MATTLSRVAESIKQLQPSKWLLDERYLAARLDISPDQLVTFVDCIESGGFVADGRWKPNPRPYDIPIQLSDQSSKNILDLYLFECGACKAIKKVELTDTSPDVAVHGSIFYRVGGVDKRKKMLITAPVQRDIVRWVMGTHKSLTQYWPQVGAD